MTRGFLLKKPDAKRRTFQIVPYSRVNGKKVYGSPVKNTDLEALNSKLKEGKLSEADCLVELKHRILPKLKRIAKIPDKVAADALINEINMKVYKDFWNKEYRRAKLERPTVARDEFLEALRILEPLSLISCDADDLQDHWDKNESGTRNKRYGNRVNQLLRFLKRGFEIKTDSAVIPPLKWVSWAELEKILAEVSDENLKDLYRSLWGTGARLGEMFVIEPQDIRKNGTVYITRQLDRDAKLKEYTKNKKSHHTIVLPEALEALKRWAAVEDKASYRKRCQHPLINAAKKVFDVPTKQISPHKLRHSYVRQMTQLGVPLDRIAQFIGDSVSTLEKTYRGWVVEDPEIDYVKGLMEAGYERLRNKT